MARFPGSHTCHLRTPHLEGTRDHPARARWLRPWLLFVAGLMTLIAGSAMVPSATPNDCTGCVVVDYTGVPLSVTVNWRGTNVNSVQSGTSVSLTNFTIVGNHPNQVVYLAL